jgi:hypothetical protein
MRDDNNNNNDNDDDDDDDACCCSSVRCGYVTLLHQHEAQQHDTHLPPLLTTPYTSPPPFSLVGSRKQQVEGGGVGVNTAAA